MLFDNPATKTAALILAAALSGPVLAQPGMVQPAPPPPSAPPSSWTVSPDRARGLVQIGAEAEDGSARFVGGCNKLAGPGFIGRFLGYQGGKLRTDGSEERVLFMVSGAGWREAFAATLRYAASSGSWEIVDTLAPVFVNSFSRGGRLTVLNGEWQEVFSFDLTGSTIAARTMREVCGFS
jgi:hypothetical protein